MAAIQKQKKNVFQVVGKAVTDFINYKRYLTNEDLEAANRQFVARVSRGLGLGGEDALTYSHGDHVLYCNEILSQDEYPIPVWEFMLSEVTEMIDTEINDLASMEVYQPEVFDQKLFEKGGSPYRKSVTIPHQSNLNVSWLVWACDDLQEAVSQDVKAIRSFQRNGVEITIKALFPWTHPGTKENFVSSLEEFWWIAETITKKEIHNAVLMPFNTISVQATADGVECPAEILRYSFSVGSAKLQIPMR